MIIAEEILGKIFARAKITEYMRMIERGMGIDKEVVTRDFIYKWIDCYNRNPQNAKELLKRGFADYGLFLKSYRENTWLDL